MYTQQSLSVRHSTATTVISTVSSQAYLQQLEQQPVTYSTAATGTSTVTSQAYLQQLEQLPVTYSTAATGTSTVTSQAYLQQLEQQPVTYSTAATGTSTVTSQAYLQQLEQLPVTYSTAATGTSTVTSQAYLQQLEQQPVTYSTAATGTSTVTSQAYLQQLEQLPVTYSTAATVTSTVPSQAYLQHVQQHVLGPYAQHQHYTAQIALPGHHTLFPVTSTAQMHPCFTRDLSPWFISEPQFTSPLQSFTNTLFHQIPPSVSRDESNQDTGTSFSRTSLRPVASSQPVSGPPVLSVTESQFSSRPLEQGQCRRSLGIYELGTPENVQQLPGNLGNEPIYQLFTPGNISKTLPLRQQSDPGFTYTQTTLRPLEQGQQSNVSLLGTNRVAPMIHPEHQSNYPGTPECHQGMVLSRQQALPSLIPTGRSTTLPAAHQSLPVYLQAPGPFRPRDRSSNESPFSQFTTYPSLQSQTIPSVSSTSSLFTEPMTTAIPRSLISSEIKEVNERTKQGGHLPQGMYSK